MVRRRKPLDAVGEAPLVARLLRSEPAGPRRERLLAVQLGFDAVNDLDHVASTVGHARSTIQKWFDAYRLGGVEALLKDGRADNPGRANSVGPEARQAMEEGLKVGRWRTVPQMHADLSRDFGITLKIGSLYNRLGKAGARLRVPRPRHNLQNPAEAVLFRQELYAHDSKPWTSLPGGRCGCGCSTRCATASTDSPAGSGDCPATQHVYQWG